MKKTKKAPRFKFLINPAFQFSFIGFFLAISTLGFVVSFALVTKIMADFNVSAGHFGLPPDHLFYEFLSAQEMVLRKALIGTLGCTFLIMLFGGLYLSHKVAGPIYRFVRQLETFKELKKSNRAVHFRKGDYFPELAEAFNHFINKDQNPDV